MTQRPTRTGKFRGAPKQAQIRLKDFANSFNCASDPKLVSAMDSAMEACMAEAYARQYREGYTELWTDGSYDDKDHRAGIGIMIRQMRAPGSVNTGPEQDIKAIFGKAVKASDLVAVVAGVGLHVLKQDHDAGFPGSFQGASKIRIGRAPGRVCAEPDSKTSGQPATKPERQLAFWDIESMMNIFMFAVYAPESRLLNQPGQNRMGRAPGRVCVDVGRRHGRAHAVIAQSHGLDVRAGV